MATLTAWMLACSLDPLPDEPPPGYVLLQLPSQLGRTPGRLTQLTGLALLTRAGREGHVPASAMPYRNPDTAAQLAPHGDQAQPCRGRHPGHEPGAVI